MERDGLIWCTDNPGDKRSSSISFTPLALKKLPQAKTILSEGNKAALKEFTDREIATLSKLLLRVIKNLDPEIAAENTVDRRAMNAVRVGTVPIEPRGKSSDAREQKLFQHKGEWQRAKSARNCIASVGYADNRRMWRLAGRVESARGCRFHS